MLLVAFTVLWLMPFFWVGQTRALPVRVPQRLLHLYACAGLFTKRTWNWNHPLIQVRHEGSAVWKTLRTAELSPLGVYGYRQRIDRLLLKSGGTKVESAIRSRLAAWVAQRTEETEPGADRVEAVRFTQNVWPVSCPDLRSPSGHWGCDPAELGPDGRNVVMAEFSIQEGKVLPAPIPQAGKALPTPRVFSRKPASVLNGKQL